MSTLCIGRDGEQAEVRRFRPLAREDCDKRLRELTGLYRKGIRQPLFLAPELCRGFAETLAAGADEAAALAKAAAAWQYELQEARPGTEAADRYWTRLFAAPEALDKTFAANARKVWLPLLDALEDPEPEEQP